MARTAKTHGKVRSGRSRVLAMIAMLVLLTLVSGRPISAFQQNGAQAEAAAEDAQKRTQRLLAASQFGRGKLALESGQIGEALNWYLQSYLNSPADSPLRTSARNVIGANIGQITQTLVHPETVRAVATNSDGTRMSIVYQGGRSQLWDLTTGKPIGAPLAHAGDVRAGQFTPDGKTLVMYDWRGATCYDAATGKPLHEKVEHYINEASIIPPAMSPDGRRIVTRHNKTSVLFRKVPTGKAIGAPISHEGGISSFQFSPDGKRLIVRSTYTLHVWDADTRKKVGEIPNAYSYAMHPDGTTMAVCDQKGKTALWNTQTATKQVDLEHDSFLNGVLFDTNGNLLGYHRNYRQDPPPAVVVWKNVAADERSKIVIPQSLPVRSISFSPNGQYVALADFYKIRVVVVASGRTSWEKSFGTSRYNERWGTWSVQFSPDSKSILTRKDNSAIVYETQRGWILAKEDNLRAATFTPDGRKLVCSSTNGWARIRSLDGIDDRRVALLRHDTEKRRIQRVSFSDDGKTVVTAGGEKLIRVWNTSTWEPVGEPILLERPAGGVSVSPDGTICAAQLTRPSEMEFWDLKKRTRIGERVSDAHRVEFDESGKSLLVGRHVYNRALKKLIPLPARPSSKLVSVARLAARNSYRLPRLWDEEKNDLTRVQIPDWADPRISRITRDGRLISLSLNRELQVSDPKSGKNLGPRIRIGGLLVSFSDDGRYIIAGSSSTVQMWDTTTGKHCGQEMTNAGIRMKAAFSPSGKMVATYQRFYTRLRDSATGQELGPPMKNNSNGAYDLDFSPDGRWLLSTDGYYVHVFKAPQPAVDNPEHLRLLVETRTGLRVDEDGMIQRLSQAEWQKRRGQLAQFEDSAG